MRAHEKGPRSGSAGLVIARTLNADSGEVGEELDDGVDEVLDV